jgi:hypothetical protein
MRKDQFYEKHQQQSIAPEEIDRKWRVFNQELEYLHYLSEAAQSRFSIFSPQSSSGGGV